MKKIFTLTYLLFLFSILYGQENHAEKFKNHLTKSYAELEIDYDKEYDVAEILAYHENIWSTPHYISPKFAVQLFSLQTNQFQFKNKIFYYNNTPINLFEELEIIQNKFPENKWILNEENSLTLANGIHLNFTEFNGKKYLVEVDVNLKFLYDRKDKDFGIILYDGFPLNGAWYSDKSFKKLLNDLNERTTAQFSYYQSYTYTTKFEDIELKDPSFLENYFRDKEKFRRTKGKKIKNMMIMRANGISISNQLTYDGIDPEYDPTTAPYSK